MPFPVQRRHAPSRYGFVAVRAARTEQLLVAAVAIGRSVLLVKIVGAQRGRAISAHEMLGVVGFVHRLDHFAQNGFATVRAVAARRGAALADAVARVGFVYVG